MNIRYSQYCVTFLDFLAFFFFPLGFGALPSVMSWEALTSSRPRELFYPSPEISAPETLDYIEF